MPAGEKADKGKLETDVWSDRRVAVRVAFVRIKAELRGRICPKNQHGAGTEARRPRR